MVSINGRWKGPGASDEPNNPDDDFPFRETFTDCSGQARHFVISFFRVELGFAHGVSIGQIFVVVYNHVTGQTLQASDF